MSTNFCFCTVSISYFSCLAIWGGGDWRGKAVQSHLSADSWRCECSYGNALLNAIFTSHYHCDSVSSCRTCRLMPMNSELSLTEWLPNVSKILLSATDSLMNVSVCRVLIIYPFLSSDKELKTEGFSLESCRSMIALMDVSFTVHYGQNVCTVWCSNTSSLVFVLFVIIIIRHYNLVVKHVAHFIGSDCRGMHFVKLLQQFFST